MTQSEDILIVDDEPDIRDSLSDHLGRMGFTCRTASSAAAARDALNEARADLVILDIMMPGEDGLSLCRHLREVDGTPVILLTALADQTDRIVGLEIGADDYVTKPFNPRELVARIRAVLRRSGSSAVQSAAAKRNGRGRDTFAEWELDRDQGELHRSDGVVVPLSSGELNLLCVFLDNPGSVLSRDDLMSLTRGRDTLPFERSIDNMISRLRRKVEVDPKNPRIIKTIWGGGYRLIGEPDDH